MKIMINGLLKGTRNRSTGLGTTMAAAAVAGVVAQLFHGGFLRTLADGVFCSILCYRTTICNSSIHRFLMGEYFIPPVVCLLESIYIL